MNNSVKESKGESDLNPALRRTKEELHDTRSSTPPPAESTSVKPGDAWVWPIVWAVVTVVCVAIGIWLVFF